MRLFASGMIKGDTNCTYNFSFINSSRFIVRTGGLSSQTRVSRKVFVVFKNSQRYEFEPSDKLDFFAVSNFLLILGFFDFQEYYTTIQWNATIKIERPSKDHTAAL